MDRRGAARAAGPRGLVAPERAPPPGPIELERLLDEFAPLGPAPLCPEIQVFQAVGLIAVWEAAERLAGGPLAAPFWAYAWPGGSALARVILDHPDWVRGGRVLDLGAGGGVASLAAALAGGAEVVANDLDAWAVETIRLAAERQHLAVTPLLADLTLTRREAIGYDVVLCGDLAYERRTAPRQRALLQRARKAGARVLVADAGRAYFDPAGLTLLVTYTLGVPKDLEGVEERTARVYEWR